MYGAPSDACGLGLSIFPGTAAPLLISPLAVLAETQRRYEECKALQAVTGSACATERAAYDAARAATPMPTQTLPTVTVTARFPWGTVLALSALAFLALGRR